MVKKVRAAIAVLSDLTPSTLKKIRQIWSLLLSDPMLISILEQATPLILYLVLLDGFIKPSKDSRCWKPKNV